MLKEFGDFIRKGNVLDLAVAVIIGGAFGLIITSLVDDIDADHRRVAGRCGFHQPGHSSG